MPELVHLRAVLAGPIPDLIQSTWMDIAAEHAATGEYASHLSFERLYPYLGDDLKAAVRNHAPHADVLERGHGGFHLPSRIDWGAAIAKGTAHVGKRGVPYLRIAFRHGTPGAATGGIGSGRARTAMPDDVYRDALTALRGDRTRQAARDAAARLAQAGTHLSRPYATMAAGSSGRTAALLHALAARARTEEGQPGYTWRARTYQGLMRKEQVSPTTGKRSGTYLTVRTLTQDSTGWFIPPAPGFHFAERTAALVRDRVRELVGEAARADVVELVRVAVGGADV